MELLEMAADGQGLADRGAVVPFQNGQLAQRIQRQERRRLVCLSRGVQLRARDGQDLLGQEDAHTARMHCGGAVVKQRGGISW